MNAAAFVRLVRMSLRGRRLLGTVLFVGVVALASMAFVAGINSRDDAGRLWDAAFDRAAGPHVTLNAPTAEQAATAAAGDGVAAVSEPVDVGNGASLVRAGEAIGVVVRAADTANLPAVGAPYVVDGRLATGGGEVALEQSFADDLGLAVGDRVELRAEGASTSFRIVGLILDFNDCFYPQCDPGVVWTSPQGFDEIGAADRFTQVYLRLNDPEAAPRFVANALAAHGAILGGGQDWIDTRGDALAVNDFFGVFLSGFGVFVLIAAGIVVAGSVTNRILARRRDIGLLKSIGVTPRQVVATITVEHLLLGAVAVVVGWLLGSLAAPAMQIGVTEVLDAGGAAFPIGPLALTAAVMTLIVLAATVAPAMRAAQLSAATTLRPPVDPGRSAWPARVAARFGAGPVVLGAVKDVVQRPLRTTLAAMSVALAVIALIVTFGFGATIDRTTSQPELTGDPWDAWVVPSAGADHATLTESIAATPGVAAWFGESESRRVVDGEVLLARAVSGDPAAAQYVVREGRAMTAAGEGLAGYGLLQRLGRDVGDTVRVEVDDAVIDVRIVGRYSETEDTGEVLLYRAETLAVAFPDATPDVYRVVAEAGTRRDALAASLQASLGDATTVRALVVDTEDLDAFRIAFWLVAGLVLVVALANLGATVLLSVRERMRDLGVLRAIGFTPAQLVASTALGTLLLVAGAAVVGIPVGLWLTDTLLTSVGRAIGVGPEFAVAPALLPTVVTILLVVAGAAVIGGLTSVGASRRPISELVRYE